MEITKEQVLDLYKVKSDFYVDVKLQEWFPEAFKVEFKVGKVYKGEENIMVYVTDFKDCYNVSGYGFMTNGKWSESKKEFRWGFNKEIIPATTEEWESALIEEAKKRGYKEGVYLKHLLRSNEGTIKFGYSCKEISNEEFNYNKNKDYLFIGNLMIYENGIWAEIVKTISKEDAEKKLGCKII